MLGISPGFLYSAMRDRQRQRAHTFRRGQRDLLRDHAPERDAQQVESLELEVIRQSEHVLRHVGRRVVRLSERRLPHVAVVEEDRFVLLGERLDLQRPGATVAAQTVHAQQRLALTVDVVVDLQVVQNCVRHGRRAAV